MVVLLFLASRARRAIAAARPRARGAGRPGQRDDHPPAGDLLTIAAAAACLLVSQFVDYRGVEVGRPGYAGLPEVAKAPTVGVETPVDAHSYVLVPWRCSPPGWRIAAARTIGAASGGSSSPSAC